MPKEEMDKTMKAYGPAALFWSSAPPRLSETKIPSSSHMQPKMPD